MNNVLKFTLDNIIYNCTTTNEDVVEMILPKRTPTEARKYKSKTSKEETTILEPAVQTEIRLILTVSKKIPKLYIHGENNKSKIVYANSLDVQANSINQLIFTTTNGGASWLVRLINFSTKAPTPATGSIVSVNGDTGPNVVLDSSSIYLSGESGPTIIDKFNEVDTTIVDLKQTIESEVTGDIVNILPGMIEMQIKNTKIIAETI